MSGSGKILTQLYLVNSIIAGSFIDTHSLLISLSVIKSKKIWRKRKRRPTSRTTTADQQQDSNKIPYIDCRRRNRSSRYSVLMFTTYSPVTCAAEE